MSRPGQSPEGLAGVVISQELLAAGQRRECGNERDAEDASTCPALRVRAMESEAAALSSARQTPAGLRTLLLLSPPSGPPIHLEYPSRTHLHKQSISISMSHQQEVRPLPFVFLSPAGSLLTSTDLSRFCPNARSWLPVALVRPDLQQSTIGDEDLIPSQTAGYKPGQEKTLAELAALDQEDESLARWKASLGLASSGAAAGAKKVWPCPSSLVM
jgi:hypothetical protein